MTIQDFAAGVLKTRQVTHFPGVLGKTNAKVELNAGDSFTLRGIRFGKEIEFHQDAKKNSWLWEQDNQLFSIDMRRFGDFGGRLTVRQL